MKALTLWQPWASLVVLKAKRFETRSWGTSYRGPLAIHAGASTAGRDFFEELPPELRAILPTRFEALPFGAVLGEAELEGVFQIGDWPPPHWTAAEAFETSVGDFSAGRFIWYFTARRAYREPTPARGHQQVWDWWKAEPI